MGVLATKWLMALGMALHPTLAAAIGHSVLPGSEWTMPVTFVGDRNALVAGRGRGDSQHNGIITDILIYTKDSGWFTGITIKWHDGGEKTVGDPSGASKHIKLRGDEYVWSLSLSEDKQSEVHRVSRLQLATAHGRKWDIVAPGGARSREEEQEVGSGILIDFVASTSRSDDGDSLAGLGFVFLRPTEDARIEEMTYPEIVNETGGSQGTMLDSIPVPELHGQLVESRSWKLKTNQDRFHGTELAVQGDVPVVLPPQPLSDEEDLLPVGFLKTSLPNQDWEYSFERNAWELTVFVDPEISLARQELTTPFEGTMVLALKNGGEFRYRVKGTFESVQFEPAPPNIVVDNYGPYHPLGLISDDWNHRRNHLA